VTATVSPAAIARCSIRTCAKQRVVPARNISGSIDSRTVLVTHDSVPPRESAALKPLRVRNRTDGIQNLARRDRCAVSEHGPRT